MRVTGGMMITGLAVVLSATACSDAPSAPRPTPDQSVFADEGANVSAFVPLDLGTTAGLPNSVGNGINTMGDMAGASYNVDPTADGRVARWTAANRTDLGVPAGFNAAVGNAISDFGAIVGSAYGAVGRRGFVWQVGGIGYGILNGPVGTTDLDARDIEDNNLVVVGEFTNGGMVHAFRWQPATGYRDLHPAGFLSSHAEAIAPNGAVTGWVKMFGGPEHAAMWSPAGVFTDLGALVAGANAHGYDINSFGMNVGESGNGAGAVVAVLRRLPNPMAGAPIPDSRGMGISDLGRMVGWAPQAGARRAVTKRGAGALGFLPPLAGTATSDAREVNRCGQVVGSTTYANGITRATWWNNVPCD
ncbi:MAG: hypothetical protein U0163_12055 [Gemmatimonadaceae bacterium]